MQVDFSSVLEGFAGHSLVANLLGMGCSLFVCLTYVLVILRGRKDKTYGMPFAAMCINVTWEFLYTFVYHPPGQWTDPDVWMHVLADFIWFALDIGIVVTWWQFASADRPPGLSPRWRGPALALGTGSAMAVIIGMAGQFKAVETQMPGTTSCSLRCLVMSALFVAMVLRRDSAAGQSLPIAISKLLASAMGSVYLLLIGFVSWFWVSLFVLTFLFDSIYLATLFGLLYAVVPRRLWGQATAACPMPPPAPIPERHPLVILDLGTASKKRVDLLRDGRGELMADVSRALAGPRPDGGAGAPARSVVVIVEQRRKPRAPRPLDLLPFKLR